MLSLFFVMVSGCVAANPYVRGGVNYAISDYNRHFLPPVRSDLWQKAQSSTSAYGSPGNFIVDVSGYVHDYSWVRLRSSYGYNYCLYCSSGGYVYYAGYDDDEKQLWKVYNKVNGDVQEGVAITLENKYYPGSYIHVKHDASGSPRYVQCGSDASWLYFTSVSEKNRTDNRTHNLIKNVTKNLKKNLTNVEGPVAVNV